MFTRRRPCLAQVGLLVTNDQTFVGDIVQQVGKRSGSGGGTMQTFRALIHRWRDGSVQGQALAGDALQFEIFRQVGVGVHLVMAQQALGVESLITSFVDVCPVVLIAA